MPESSPIGLHRVLDPAGVLPQAARRLNASPEITRDEVRIAVERINLDAASLHQLRAEHGTPDAVRAAVLAIVAERGKMQNPVTGSGGMLIGTVDAVGPDSPLGLKVGDRVATLVSLTLTPLALTDGLSRWDGESEQVPAQGHAILFARSIAAVLPDDLEPELALAVLDVCGAPALTDRVVRRYLQRGATSVAVLGGAGKSGSLSLAAARRAGARTVAIVPSQAEHARLTQAGALAASAGGSASAGAPAASAGGSASAGAPAASAGGSASAGIADHVALADARDPVALAAAVTGALGGPADVTVVCVDVPGCEHGAILATAEGGTVIFFSMATSFSAAALGAEGLAADVTMLIGNGYLPGHADFALGLLRAEPAVAAMFAARTRR